MKDWPRFFLCDFVNLYNFYYFRFILLYYICNKKIINNMFTRNSNNEKQNWMLYGICVDIENNMDCMSPQENADWFRSDECREIVGEEDYPEYLEAVEFVLNDVPAFVEVLKAWQASK